MCSCVEWCKLCVWITHLEKYFSHQLSMMEIQLGIPEEVAVWTGAQPQNHMTFSWHISGLWTECHANPAALQAPYWSVARGKKPTVTDYNFLGNDNNCMTILTSSECSGAAMDILGNAYFSHWTMHLCFPIPSQMLLWWLVNSHLS